MATDRHFNNPRTSNAPQSIVDHISVSSMRRCYQSLSLVRFTGIPRQPTTLCIELGKSQIETTQDILGLFRCHCGSSTVGNIWQHSISSGTPDFTPFHCRKQQVGLWPSPCRDPVLNSLLDMLESPRISAMFLKK